MTRIALIRWVYKTMCLRGLSFILFYGGQIIVVNSNDGKSGEQMETIFNE